MLHRNPLNDGIIVFGTGRVARDWIRNHPNANVEFVAEESKHRSQFQAIKVVQQDQLAELNTKIILLAVDESERTEKEIMVLNKMSKDQILLYPEELQGDYYKSMKGR